MPKQNDLTGERYGLLTVLSYSHRKDHIGPSGKFWYQYIWSCRCDCGTEHLIDANNLRAGRSRSCGCRQGGYKHGDARTFRGVTSQEYSSWEAMNQRCSNMNSSAYSYYGGRGIIVCARWRDSFEAFLSDMGRKPSPSHSIDRVDNNGNYEPTNCRWADKTEQSINQRIRKDNKTGVRGVSFDWHRCVYVWDVMRYGKKARGRSETMDKAIAARQLAIYQLSADSSTSAVRQRVS